MKTLPSEMEGERSGKLAGSQSLNLPKRMKTMNQGLDRGMRDFRSLLTHRALWNPRVCSGHRWIPTSGNLGPCQLAGSSVCPLRHCCISQEQGVSPCKRGQANIPGQRPRRPAWDTEKPSLSIFSGDGSRLGAMTTVCAQQQFAQPYRLTDSVMVTGE